MWTTSVARQAARANASACTGEGPAELLPSIVMEVEPETPENFRSPIQVRSATVGGLLTGRILPDFGSRGSSGSSGARSLSGSELTAAPREEEPPERQDDEHVGQRVAEDAVGAPRLRRGVDEFAVRQVALLRHL